MVGLRARVLGSCERLVVGIDHRINFFGNFIIV
jgi:hypothetical protein